MSAEGKALRGTKPAAPVRLLLSVLASAVFVAVMTASMVNVLLPAIGEDFGASEAQVGWVVTGFFLVLAVAVPLYGRISDFFSIRRVFSLALLVFAAGGLICALAPNLPVLVLGRVVQAAGDAAIPALAFVAVARALPPGERGGAFGTIASSVGLGVAAGPTLGGAVGQLLGWRLLFLGTLLLMLLLVPLALRVLPDGGPGGGREGEQGAGRRFDLAGGVLLGLAATLFLFGITQGQAAGFASSSSWGSFLLATLAAALFARRIGSVPEPFVSPALFENRAYVTAALVGFLTFFANVSMFVFVPLLVVEVNGLSPGAAGLVLTPGALAQAVLPPLAGRVSDRLGARAPILAGLTVMFLSVLFVSAFAAGAPPLLVSAGMLGAGVGFALANPPTANAAANALSEEEAGGGLGIFQGLLFLGGAAGPALVGAFLAARREGDVEALNPLYLLDAAPFSDTFLAIAIALLIALVAASALRGNPKGGEEIEQGREGRAA